MLTAFDKKLLNVLQAGLPISSRPFADLAQDLESDEKTVLARLKELKAHGYLRRIGPFFDSAKMGYRGTLVALRVAPEAMESVAKAVNRHVGATHNYEREGRYNLWFSARRRGAFEPRFAQEVQGQCAVQAELGGVTMEKLDEIDRKITRAMQGDFPLVEEPYKEIAAQVGIEEEELLRRLRRLKENGQIRKMGAVLQHRAAGYTSNVLCAWVVPPERMDETARCMCANPAVSHCYDRDTAEDWPYNVYTMIHAKSREECEAVAAALAAECGLEERVMLYSVKEWKKTSMRYFCEEEEGSA